MKITDPRCIKAGAILVYLIGGLIWSVHSRADDQFKSAVVAALAPRPKRKQSLHLPALKAGGFSGGQVLLITYSGVERMNFMALVQCQMRLTSPFPDFCNAH